jgi:hypothetical protein
MNRALWSLAAIGGRMNGIKWALLTLALLTIALSAANGRLDPIGPLSPLQNASIYVFLAGACATMGGLDALDYYVPNEVSP